MSKNLIKQKGKPIGTKDKKRGQKKGLKPKQRKLATTVRTQAKRGKLTANQWQNTPQQNKFMECWLTPSSPTFSNAYRSAIEAGYSPHYAAQIISTKSTQKWITDYMRNNIMNEEHVRQGIQELALKANDSRSPDDTRLKAYELLGKATGLLNDKQQINVINVQPILGGSSVQATPKQVDAEQS